MKAILLVSTIALNIIASAPRATAQDGEAVGVANIPALRAQFEELRADLSRDLVAFDTRYEGELQKLEEAATAEGNLQVVLAVRTEKESFRRRGGGAQDPSDFPRLAHLQKIYAEQTAKLVAERASKLVALAAGYRKNLKDMQMRLTKEKKIDEALRIQEELAWLDAEAEKFAEMTPAGAGRSASEGRAFTPPSGSVGALPDALPDPDGKEADMSKPVQVYILLGQSNMLGFGKPDVLQGIAAQKYPYLVDDAGAWTVRKDVRNVRVMCSGNSPAKDFTNDWMTIQGNIGPEIGIGHYVGHVTDAPVLILKSCIGNRSLGWDLLPPGSEPYEHGGKTQPGYRGTPDDPGGDTGGDMSKGWYAGCQYDGDIAAAKAVLENLDKYYPGAKEYEVAGFFWWQGDKDMRDHAHFERYEKNLIQLIRALRKDFDAPDAKFVTASLGQTEEGSKGGDGVILDAMKAVAESDDPELEGKVGFVYSHPLSKGGSSSGHYGGNPETYMNIGEAMGKAMVELLQGK